MKIKSLILLACCCLAAVATWSQSPNPAALRLNVEGPFQFVVYGDARFTSPRNQRASSPAARRALVEQTAQAHPRFILFTGDLVWRGDDAADWEAWDAETKPWTAAGVKVYPSIGNHELHADAATGLRNYFARFPELAGSRYYSLRAGNTLTLVLDSALPEVSGPQGEWLARQLDSLPKELDFVFVVLHHPLYTNSTDRFFGGGHGARAQEQALAALLEQRQAQNRARFVVFSGHVHNYERYEHNGVTYIVSGGGGATPYAIPRGPSDAYRGTGTTYHYCQAEVNGAKLTIQAMKLELGEDGKQTGFHAVDSVTLAPAAKAKAAAF